MKTLVYTNKKSAEWVPGAWNDEPDKLQWEDEKTKLPCLAVRNSRSGVWCGYVGVPESHRAYKLESDMLRTYPFDLQVHGGITFTGHCQKGKEEETICHRVEPGESDNVWWIGFDTAHYQDFIPGLASLNSLAVYKTLSYVRAECQSLAKQLSDKKFTR